VAVCLSTPPERLLAALVWFRVPRALAFTVLAALRFLPVVAEEAATVARARWLRAGGRRPRGGWRARGLAWLETPRLVGPVLAAAVRRAATLALAVTARGFAAGAEPTPYPPWRPRLVERLAAGGLVAAFVAVAALKTAVAASMAGWWTGPASAALREFVRAWL
jgi:energy-coupling factor transport system permease protein